MWKFCCLLPVGVCIDAVMAICGFVLCVSTLLSQHPTRNNIEYLEKIFFFQMGF